MKRLLLIACFFLITLAHANSVESANPQEEQLLAAIKEVEAQQALLAGNQAKIEEKLATIVEAIRVARIYSSRSGN